MSGPASPAPAPLTDATPSRSAARYVMFAGPILVFAMVLAGLGFVAYRASRDRAAARGAEPREFEGIAYVAPSAVVRVWGDSRGEGPRTMLIVDASGRSAAERLAPYDGRAVRIRGNLRDGDGPRTFILDDDTAAVVSTDNLPTLLDAQLRWSAPRPLGPTTVRGEFVGPDPIGNGGPAVLKAQDRRGRVTFYVLANASGRALSAGSLPKDGPIRELTGNAEQWGDLTVLRVAADASPRP